MAAVCSIAQILRNLNAAMCFSARVTCDVSLKIDVQMLKKWYLKISCYQCVCCRHENQFRDRVTPAY